MHIRLVRTAMIWFFGICLVFSAIAAPIWPAVAYAADEEASPYDQLTENDYWPGQIIVKLKDRPDGVGTFSAYSYSLFAEVEGVELETVDTLDDDTILYRTSGDIFQTLEALEDDPRVEYAQPRYIYYLFTDVIDSKPNDPDWTKQWDMHDDWGLDLSGAWSYTQGSADVVVAVVDTGVDYLHEDLNIGSGRVLVLDGSNLNVTEAKDANTPLDGIELGHGTHVAGTIAATVDNGLGIAGVAPNTSIMPVKVGPDDQEVLYFVEEGVKFAGEHGAKVVNLSLGGNYCGNPLLYEIIKSYPDVLFVAAAGNNGEDLAEYPVFPAIYSADSVCFGTPYPALPNVVTVGSVDDHGKLSDFSNFSDTYVNLSAPGWYIYSMYPRDAGGNSRYSRMSGTSMAAPHVSGAAALIYSLAPDLSPGEVIDILERTVTPSDGLVGKVKTGGTLNAGAALAYTSNRLKPIKADKSGTVASGTTVTLSTYTADIGADIYYTLDGSEPIVTDGVVVSGERYDGPIVIDKPVTIKARAYKDGVLRSETAEFTYLVLLGNSADLSGLTISSGTLNPEFDRYTTTYTVSVPHNVDHVTVTAATYDPRAAVQINDLAAPVSGSTAAEVVLNAGANDIAVTVTSEDLLSTNVYHLEVTRAENDEPDGGTGDTGGTGGDTDDGGTGDTGGSTGTVDTGGTTMPALPANTSELVLAPTLGADSDVALAVLNQETWDSALANAEIDENHLATVKVVLPEVENASAYKLSIPLSALAASGADTRLSIDTAFGTFILPGNMIAPGEGESDTTISLSIKRLTGEHPGIQVELTIGDEPYHWGNSAAPVEISIPYSPTQKELAALEHLTIQYIDAEGEATAVPSGRYNPATGTVDFIASHFSDYVVAFVNKSFDDLQNVPWAQKPIEVLAAKGVINGTSAQSFTPGASVTRADFIVLLTRMLGLSANTDSMASLPEFNDVTSDAYYADAVHIAQQLGIALGSGDGSFRPNEFISRQDMMVLTVRAMQRSGQWSDDEAGDQQSLTFDDMNDVAEYALNSVALLNKKGLIEGAGGKVNPLHNSSRAEAAVLLYRIYNLMYQQ